jgi:biotin carboxyl carrier protein
MNDLQAERSGVVKAVNHVAGAVVDGDEVIIEFELSEEVEADA